MNAVPYCFESLNLDVKEIFLNKDDYWDQAL